MLLVGQQEEHLACDSSQLGDLICPGVTVENWPAKQIESGGSGSGSGRYVNVSLCSISVYHWLHS